MFELVTLANNVAYNKTINIFEKLFEINFLVDFHKDGKIKSIKFNDERKKLYRVLGFDSCYTNSIPTRVRCPICVNHRKNHQCRIYKSAQSVSMHIVGNEHKQDSFTLEIQQALKFVEIHSIMLQMKVLEGSQK